MMLRDFFSPVLNLTISWNFFSRNSSSPLEPLQALQPPQSLQQKHPSHLSHAFVTSFNYFLQECLNEKQRRLCSGLFALLFDNMSYVHDLTLLSPKTIRRGKIELLKQLTGNTLDQPIRYAGGGRPSKIVGYEETVLQYVEKYTAGDPMSKLKWTRVTLRIIAAAIGNVLSHVSVAKILRNNDYSLLVNKKTKRSRNKHPGRDKQFDFIEQSTNRHLKRGNPVIAIDGKKTERIGAFRQEGKTWVKRGQEYPVFDHDFSNLSQGKLIPYGIYDNGWNEGYIVAGTSVETTEFAVDALILWWENHGQEIYQDCNEIYITCDAGKPNSYRGNLFKYLLQIKFVDKFGITLHISHYAPGDSKYHSIERRLFSFISLNFRGNPLYSYDKALELIRNTTTNAGLSVKAKLHYQQYQRDLAKNFSETDYETINISRADINGEFNYTIHPRNKEMTLGVRIKAERERIEKQIWHFSNQVYDSKKTGIAEAKTVVKESKWQYHSFTATEITNKLKRADGEVGRPAKGSKMVKQFHVRIKYAVLKEYRQYSASNSEIEKYTP